MIGSAYVSGSLGEEQMAQSVRLGPSLWCMCAHLCPVFAVPWTVARQTYLSMGFSRQGILEWVATPAHRPDPGITPVSPALAGVFFTFYAAWEALVYSKCSINVSNCYCDSKGS